MDPLILTCILATFFFAAFLKGTAGLGFATTCLGIMASYIDMRLAIPLVIIPSLLANAMVMIEAGGFLSILRRFWFMLAFTLPGLALGLWVLGEGDTLFSPPQAHNGRFVGAIQFAYFFMVLNRFLKSHQTVNLANRACLEKKHSQ